MTSDKTHSVKKIGDRWCVVKRDAVIVKRFHTWLYAVEYAIWQNLPIAKWNHPHGPWGLGHD